MIPDTSNRYGVLMNLTIADISSKYGALMNYLISGTSGPSIQHPSTPAAHCTLPWPVLSLNMPLPSGIPSTKFWLIGLSPRRGLLAVSSCSNGSYHMMSFSIQESDWPTLAKRRDAATLCHLFKIFHGLCSSPNLYRPHPRPSLRHLNSCAVEPLLPPVSFEDIFLTNTLPHYGITYLKPLLSPLSSKPSNWPSTLTSFSRLICVFSWSTWYRQ